MSDIYEITEGFEDPSFTGSSASARPERTGYPLALEGRGYMIDWTSQIPYTRKGVDLLNTQQAQSGGDQSQVPPNIWRRSMESWHQGDGQARLDRDDSLPFRFSRSSGIDPWEPWRLSLLHDVDNVQALADEKTFVETITGYVIVVVNDDGYWLDTTTMTWATCDFGDTVIDTASDGTTLYVLLDDGTVDLWTDPTAVDSTLVASAVSNWNQSAATLDVVKGFLLLTCENILYDATSGTPDGFYTHPNAGFTWGKACDGQQAGYILGGTGDRWHIFALTLKDDGTTFNPPIIATTLPDGEVPTALAEYLGFVLIGSQRGFRMAAEQDGLTYGRLVETDAPVECFEGQDRFVWYGRSTVSEGAGLGRADLSVFTSPLTPAVASDLSQDEPGRVAGIVTVGDRRLFVVEGEGAFLESTDYVAEGWLETGAMTFGATDPKQGVYVQALYDDLVAAGGVEISYRKDGGTWEEIGSALTGVTMGNLPLGVLFTTLELRIRLTASTPNPTLSPVFTRIESRAVVVPGRSSEWTVPILLSDSLDYMGAVEARSVIEDFDHLLGLVQSRRNFQFREGTRTFGVFATDFYWFPQAESDRMQSYRGTFVISLREVL